MAAPSPPDDPKLAALRDALPATGAGIYLDTATAGPLPAETHRAMAEQLDWDLRTGRAHAAYQEETQVRMDEARAAVAAILGSGLDSIVLTHGAEGALAAAAWGLDWRPGDLVLVSSLEHRAGRAALGSLGRLGVRPVVIDGDDTGDDDRATATLERALADGQGKVRLVMTQHVAETTGAVMPLRRMADLAHAAGALLLVDGTQAAGAIPVRVEDLGADLYAVGGQAWLLGPEGTGALYRSGQAVAGLRWAGRSASRRGSDPLVAEGFPRASVVGLARSCGWLSMYVGLPWIHQRVASLARQAAALLTPVPGLSVLTPAGSPAGILTFRIAGWTAGLAAEELGRRTFAILATLPSLDALRISVGFFNTATELARLRDGVAELAAHTPATLPARPALTILRQEGA